ncbi:MAG TPA: hypothetical protein VFX49_14540, partial [Chloroflexota bacterium]|nr:hypothetical protein [Chloroflexota bacterium]
RGRDGRQGHGAPILVMTAAGPGAERAAAALPGVRAALGKPMDVERLYGELARLVGGATGR